MKLAESDSDPILADAKEMRPLSGLSGARVALITRDRRTWFVRKAARDPAGSDRLRRQLAKQLAFQARMSDELRTPRVLDQGEVDGRFYFDMEFVRGTDGVSYLRRASYPDVIAMADRLCSYLRDVAAQPAPTSSSPSLFDALYTKVCDVQRRTRAIESATLARVFIALERVREFHLSTSLCHGDLTLENVIVDEHGKFWLFDFLDAPYEHWCQDVAKLHQDLEGGWYRLSHPPIARCVLEYLSQRLLAAASELASVYRQIHAVLLACTFVRILPYARTPDELEFVKVRVDYFARISSEESRDP